MDDTVLDDCDFLLELAEEAAQEKGLVPPAPAPKSLSRTGWVLTAASSCPSQGGGQTRHEQASLKSESIK
eukprot:212935-Pelagomonas_calceolata.AAC.1